MMKMKVLLPVGMDSDYMSDQLNQNSVSGFHITITGGTDLSKTKYQNTVTKNSTEAEFIVSAEVGRYILYLHTIVNKIGLPQHHTTAMYENNQDTLLMEQAGQPRKCMEHIDTSYFVLES